MTNQYTLYEFCVGLVFSITLSIASVLLHTVGVKGLLQEFSVYLLGFFQIR